ncbi:MAG: hypothetical protein J6A15_06020 [Clostridia bacterium]|nr:hypothetical protein [Clostridia bacterium]
MKKKNFKNRLLKSMGGTEEQELMGLEMKDLIDDDCDQIIISTALFKAFVQSSKTRKNYDADKIKPLFKYVVYLYNDTIQVTEKYGGLTYLEKICECLDYLTISNLTELSLEQLNLILANNGDNILDIYTSIKEKRHTLDSNDFGIYSEMLKNNGTFKAKFAKKTYAYIQAIYNENTILQDNVDYITFLKNMATLNQESILSMRMYQFLEMFNIYNINHENVNELKGLVNDLSEVNFGTLA